MAENALHPEPRSPHEPTITARLHPSTPLPAPTPHSTHTHMCPNQWAPQTCTNGSSPHCPVMPAAVHTPRAQPSGHIPLTDEADAAGQHKEAVEVSDLDNVVHLSRREHAHCTARAAQAGKVGVGDGLQRARRASRKRHCNYFPQTPLSGPRPALGLLQPVPGLPPSPSEPYPGLPTTQPELSRPCFPTIRALPHYPT